MLCEICKKNPATVHIQEIVNGEKHVMHFCAECAEKKSMLDPFLKGMTLAGLIRKMEEMTPDSPSESEDGGEPEAEEKAVVCPQCGWTEERLRKTGRLGCPACYSVFFSLLDKELAGIHRGLVSNGSFPPGPMDSSVSVPCSSESGAHVRNRLAVLRKNLDESIRREEFELAAELRDRIKKLEKEEEEMPG